jgi:hypothetical protein
VLIDGLDRGPRGFVASKDRQISLREVGVLSDRILRQHDHDLHNQL